MNLTDEAKSPATQKPKTGVKKTVAGKGSVHAKPIVKRALAASPTKKIVARKRATGRVVVGSKSYRVPQVKKGRTISAASLLGVRKARDNDFLTAMDWVSVIRQGIPSTAVDTLVDFLSITKSELSDAIDIPFRTLVRRKGEALLDRGESAKLVRVARVIERAEAVFEDPNSARVWLKSPNTSLSGQSPMSLLDTELGAESVMDTLGRIEHGVFN